MNAHRGLFIGIMLLFFSVCSVSASHIVGGSISYTYIDKYKYLITLEYYKDCSPSAIDYPPGNLRIGIYGKSTNTLVRTIDLIPGPIKAVDFLVGNCISSPVSCVQKRIYQDTLRVDTAIFKDTLGYYLNYEQCCRNYGIKNIDRPDNSGIAYYADFPAIRKNGVDFVNSSPQLISEQNLYLCAGEDFYADYAHSDIDGDSIVYKIVPPLIGSTNNANNNANGISILNPGPYDEVVWQTGYSMNNILDGNPDISIDSITGMLYVNPQQMGLYSFAIGIYEYRNGKLISSIRREIQYQVINCPVRNAPEISWLNATENILNANTELCLQFTSEDINVDDSLSISIHNISSELLRNSIEIEYDTLQKNPVNYNVCIKSKCDLIASDNEGFQLIVSDNSCPKPKVDTIEVKLKSVSIDLGEPFKNLPNVFTPNKDGVNDYFSFNSTYPSSCIDDFKISIYNRWGEKVYESTDFGFKWSGENLPTGVYFYVIKLLNKETAGSISIMF